MRAAIGVIAMASALGAAAATAGCGADDRPASWGYLHAAIIAPNCATVSCHSRVTEQAGLRLDDERIAYRALVADECDDVDPPAGALGGYVVPTEPDRSYLMTLLVGDEVARSMPPDRLLPLADVDLVAEWIARGAPCD